MNTSMSKTYSSSKKFVSERKNYAISLGFALLVMAIVIYLVIGGRDADFILYSLPYFLGFLSFIGVLLFVQMRHMLRQFRLMSVLTDEIGIHRLFGSKKLTTSWDSIRKIEVAYSVEKSIIAISVFTDQRIPIVLAGVNDMEALLKDIQFHAVSDIPHQAKHQRFNWHSPVAPWLMILGSGVIIGFLGLIGGINVVSFFNFGMQLLLGVLFLFFDPVSRFNVNYRRFEIILGLFMIVGAVMQIAFRYAF